MGGGEERQKFVSPAEISEKNFERIIVCCDSEVEIYNQIVSNLSIDPYKLLWYKEIFDKRNGFYSEKNEDIMAMYLLSLIGITHDFSYLELGTNHPVLGNNTYAFSRRGGKGVLVEANPELSAVIQGIRRGDTLINKAITLDGEPAEFYRLNQSGLGTIAYEKADELTKKQYDSFSIKEKKVVPGIMVSEAIEILDNQQPDLMSIDIEGLDWDVLHQIDFCDFRPKVIISETAPWGYYSHTTDEFDNYFDENGYRLFHFNGANSIYFDRRYESKIV